ncbi:uncharacterized protein [Canis lupus baileyi]|uniref:uncharacterized protein LOC112670468 isoform X1 n=1 Tax=Canis lupus dingo TaxID=286419 RepID=UPI0020C5A71E|nr:uncharacterized protein LOC112670468 isoform X1 [Canis lupus dingo]
MEVLESGEQSVLQWDRKLSELSEPGETEALMYHTRERERKQAGAGEGEAGIPPLSREPNGRLNYRTWDHDLSQRQMLNQLRQSALFTMVKIRKQPESTDRRMEEEDTAYTYYIPAYMWPHTHGGVCIAEYFAAWKNDEPVIMVKAAGMVAAELGQILPFTTSAVEFLRRHSEAHIICSCVCLKRPSVNKS